MAMTIYPKNQSDEVVKEWLAVPLVLDTALTLAHKRNEHAPGQGPKSSQLAKLSVLCAASVGKCINPAQLDRVLPNMNLWQQNVVRAFRDSDSTEMIVYYAMRYVRDTCAGHGVTGNTPTNSPSDLLVQAVTLACDGVTVGVEAEVRYAEVRAALDATAEAIGMFRVSNNTVAPN